MTPRSEVPFDTGGHAPPTHGRTAHNRSAPALSVVIVSWNSARFLDGCLTSVFAQEGVEVEAIVVDNGSSDGSPALVREHHPGAVLIELGENRGFCAANNAGLARARAPFVLFANADLVLDSRFAAEALAAFGGDERIGAVSGKLLRFDRKTVDSAGQFLTRSRRVVERGYGLPLTAAMEDAGYIFSVCGAALLCRREMIEDISVGGWFFDEDFFAFSEDLDLGWRARIAGWRAWYAPRAVAYHYRGGTEAEGSAGWSTVPALVRRGRSLRFHILKNRWLTLLKNDSAVTYLRDLTFILVRDFAMLAASGASSPGVLVDLVRARGLVSRARARRREFLAREGRWGSRQAGARSAWVRWTAPKAHDAGAE